MPIEYLMSLINVVPRRIYEPEGLQWVRFLLSYTVFFLALGPR